MKQVLRTAFYQMVYGVKADYCLVGRLVDHNAHKHGMSLPPRGRIVTLLTEVQEIDPLMELRHGGMYELDLWLPPENYTRVNWDEKKGRLQECCLMLIFIASCQGVADAPPETKYLLVSAERRSGGGILYRQLEPLKEAVHPVERGVLDLTWDQYALRRGERESRY